jgi:uroporphyrinogen-III decarboxylase
MISGKENSLRINKSLAGIKLDRHAFHFFADAPFLCSVAQVPLGEYYNDYKLMLDVQINVFDQMGKNGLVSPEYGAVMECSGFNSKIHKDAVGIMSAYPIGINELSDVLKLKPVDLYGDNMMAKSLEALEYMKHHVPEGYEVNPCRIMAPFTVAATLRGISDFCVDLYENEDLVFALMEISLETSIRYAQEMKRILGKLDYLLQMTYLLL